ncbi:lectin receptor kinase [Medicago truncatula]|uniref:Lectin receptor kinase n=1 Tax=Medicago truncatula TaxID=3880 RepID=A0A072TTB3_MEDTR|nr:lectin receptor kinase [Medicago truncatula]
MAIFTYASYNNQTKNTSFSMLIIIFTLFYAFFNPAHSISFNFTSFQSNLYLIKFQGDAFSSNNVLQLTKNQLDGPITRSVGRASFDQPLKLYDKETKELTDFTTHFTFIMRAVNLSLFGDGLSFFMAPFQSDIPENSAGGYLGLFSQWIEIHNILTWSFNSSLKSGNGKNIKVGLGVGLSVGFGSLTCLVGLLWFTFWRKRKVINKGERDNNRDFDASIDEDEFERGTGPKRFTYKELSNSTNGFDEKGKLGEGGFGGVYKGLLEKNNKLEVAVKRVSKGSRQGKKEYISEVRIISKLRHRNLVQLLGWCHEKSELLLVYEYMPNGSLDYHLFGKGVMLTWSVRYKIALGIASSLLYLHEEWEQCVVHRDIKSSNVMLDANFNAKLGDFGLARLVDHELGSQTTVLAGTMGYLAPECVTTGKSSKESDVYSFGVVALEITCGRRSIESNEEAKKIRLVEWVWELYGKGELFEGVDRGLNLEFDERKMECLMVVGLWCCHPDFTMRPSIRQVINVLNFEAPLPSLPSKLPVPMYFAPPMEMCRFSYTSDGLTNTTKGSSTYSSISAGSRKSLL